MHSPQIRVVGLQSRFPPGQSAFELQGLAPGDRRGSSAESSAAPQPIATSNAPSNTPPTVRHVPRMTSPPCLDVSNRTVTRAGRSGQRRLFAVVLCLFGGPAGDHTT